jgi:hypothetical protein
MIDRNRFKEAASQKLQERGLSASLHLIHAAVPMEKMTASAEWNSYLQLIEGMLEKEQQTCDRLQQELSSPNLANVERLMQLKLQLAGCLASLKTLTEVRDLPIDIVGAAARAKERL